MTAQNSALYGDLRTPSNPYNVTIKYKSNATMTLRWSDTTFPDGGKKKSHLVQGCGIFDRVKRENHTGNGAHNHAYQLIYLFQYCD